MTLSSLMADIRATRRCVTLPEGDFIALHGTDEDVADAMLYAGYHPELKLLRARFNDIERKRKAAMFSAVNG